MDNVHRCLAIVKAIISTAMTWPVKAFVEATPSLGVLFDRNHWQESTDKR
jgi:hypothetical protein